MDEKTETDNIFRRAVSADTPASKIFGQQDEAATLPSESHQTFSQPTNSSNILLQETPVSKSGNASILNPSQTSTFTENLNNFPQDKNQFKASSTKNLFGGTSRAFPVFPDKQFGSKVEPSSLIFGMEKKPTASAAAVTEALKPSNETLSGYYTNVAPRVITNPLFKGSLLSDKNEAAPKLFSKIQSEEVRHASPQTSNTNIDNYDYWKNSNAPSKLFGNNSKCESDTAVVQFGANDDFPSKTVISVSDGAQKIDLRPKTSTFIFGSGNINSDVSFKTSPEPVFGSKGDNSLPTVPASSQGFGSSSIVGILSSKDEFSSKIQPKGSSSKAKGSFIFSNDHAKDSENISSNIFGGPSLLKNTSSSLLESEGNLKRPFSPSSSVSSDFVNSAGDLKTIDVVPSKQPESQNIIDDDIFGIANFEESKDLPEKKSESTRLIAVNIDEKYLDKSILKTHFSKFGNVDKISIIKKSNQAEIYFVDHSSAAEAKAKGKRLHPKIPEMKLFYGAVTEQKKKSTSRKRDEPSKSLEPFQSKKLFTGRSVISYGDLDKTSFDKPTAPMPKTKSSHKPALKATSSRESALIKSYKLHKPVSPVPGFKVNSSTTSEIFKPSPTPPIKVFGSVMPEKRKPDKSSPEIKSSKLNNLEESVRKNDLRNKAPSANITSIKDNSVLLKQQAHNNYDKYLILDARDKNLRQKQEKILDVNKAHYHLATCPDMCPEKERFSRDIQYDLSVYELSNGKLDDRLCVKKFSRSSADKDEPLPHELRSGPVLKLTMDYLICNIIDKEKQITQLDVWYNYLCNRTRALRNDIMTQHLIDDNAVYVLEKITRFHIHCSHHLCEEPADLFDSKMNAEHLTKSLQSLKELYLDMSEKNVFYDSEAEFRTYEILIDAKDGNVIFKYLKFRNAVRNSEYVQFAVKVLNAIQSNNFVKFFKLLASATYLQACIMHRHFLSLRLKALSVITKAYSLPKESQALPVERVMGMLGFSNEINFQSFIKHCGLTVEDSKININKNSFVIDADNLPPLKKSIDLVESKKQTTAGIIVQGRSLPKNPLRFYNPHVSFDALGYLKPEALDASDQSVKISFAELSRCPEPKPPIQESLSHVDTKDMQHVSTDEIERNVIEKVKFMHKINLEKKFFNAWKQFSQQQKESKTVAKNTRIKQIISHWRMFTSVNSKLNQTADRHVISKYFRIFKSNVLLAKKTRIIKHKLDSLNEKILARKVINKWKNMVKEHKRNTAIRLLREKVVTRKFFINWRLKTILLKLERRVDLYLKSKLLKIYLAKWKTWLALRKGKRKIDYESFPACGSQLPLKTQNELWSWGYNREKSSNLSVFQIFDLDKEICNRSKKHIAMQKMAGLIAWSTMPLVQRFQSYIDSQCIKNFASIYHPPFKIVITIIPSTDSYFIEWIRTKFNFNESDQFDDSKVTLCSRQDGGVYSIIVNENSKQTDKIDASLRILVCDKLSFTTCERMIECQNSLSSLILCCSWDGDSSFNDNSWFLNKAAVDDPATSEKLFHTVFGQWKYYIENTKISESTLQTLASSFISKKVIGPVFHTASKAIQRGQPFLSPSIFVSYYNDGLAHIIKGFEKARTLIGVSSENWNDEIVSNIIGTIQKAFLPDFSVYNWPLNEDVSSYLTKFLKDVTDSGDWCGNLLTEIRKIMNISATNSPSGYDDTFYSVCKAVEIPWLDIISCCIFYKISYLPNVMVFYDFNFLENYTCQRWVTKVKESELSNFHKMETFNKDLHKRKASQLPLSSQPKLKQIKVSSKLLEDLTREKEAYLFLEDKFGPLDEIEKELKQFQVEYNLRL